MKLPYCIILQFFVILAFVQKLDTNSIVVTAAEEPVLYLNCENAIIDLVHIDRVSHLGRFPIPYAYSCEIKGDNIFENMIIFYLAKKE